MVELFLVFLSWPFWCDASQYPGVTHHSIPPEMCFLRPFCDLVLTLNPLPVFISLH